MPCPVCGHQEAGALCPRCGTDIRALSGEDGKARLEVIAVPRSASERHAKK
ncbi:MAG TPA: hypothetical protein VGR51_08360 [Thermoplasmata archaeon]|nr:hypothetical protein [Thermoplasmata archaeon]